MTKNIDKKYNEKNDIGKLLPKIGNQSVTQICDKNVKIKYEKLTSGLTGSKRKEYARYCEGGHAL